MILLYIRRICFVVRTRRVSEEDKTFKNHVMKNIVHDSDMGHFLVPVFSYVVLTLSTQFLLHIMLSMGCYDTEID